jgi:hypothetical protein
LHCGFQPTSATETMRPQALHDRTAKRARRYAGMSDTGISDTGISDSCRSMKPTSRPSPRSDHDACLPSEVERLLLDVAADGFVLYCCGPRATPFGLVASQWEGYVDLVTIRCIDRVTAVRVPVFSHGPVDVFAPQVVVWTCEGLPQWALRALFTLTHPQHPHAPTNPYPAPSSLYILRVKQRPMTIRLLPSWAGRRAARLAATMSAVDSDPIMANVRYVRTG